MSDCGAADGLPVMAPWEWSYGHIVKGQHESCWFGWNTIELHCPVCTASLKLDSESNTYLRAAIEILTMPGGPSQDAIRTAIKCLKFHVETGDRKLC